MAFFNNFSNHVASQACHSKDSVPNQTDVNHTKTKMTFLFTQNKKGKTGKFVSERKWKRIKLIYLKTVVGVVFGVFFASNKTYRVDQCSQCVYFFFSFAFFCTSPGCIYGNWIQILLIYVYLYFNGFSMFQIQTRNDMEPRKPGKKHHRTQLIVILLFVTQKQNLIFFFLFLLFCFTKCIKCKQTTNKLHL